MKPAQAIAILSVLLLAALPGCATYDADHPTTGSRSMTDQEQESWRDPTGRHDKSVEWHRDRERLSRDRLARYFR
jgi:hypothetical protein